MSTLKLENIKHENSVTNNLVMDSDGSVTIRNIKLSASSSGTDGSKIYFEPTTSLATGNALITVNATYPTGATRMLGIDSSGTQIGHIAWSHDYNNMEIIAQKPNAGIDFYTNGFNKNMSISKDGHVQTPNNPAFHAYHNAGQSWANQVIIGNSTSFNIGNHYSTSTGLFTAPVAGVYFFRCDWRTTDTAGNWIDIRTSNGRITRHEEYPGRINHFHQTLAMVTYLNANDTAYAYAGSKVQWDTNQIDGFSGFLVG